MVEIYFDTTTFDEIEKDVKVTIEAQLGLIGGTLGLLTGFSIIRELYFFLSCNGYSQPYIPNWFMAWFMS